MRGLDLVREKVHLQIRSIYTTSRAKSGVGLSPPASIYTHTSKAAFSPNPEIDPNEKKSYHKIPPFLFHNNTIKPSRPIYTRTGSTPNEPNHKLSLSKLNRSPLLSFLTIPSLRYLSSPLAVLPPTYHFSPKSLKPPSLLVSLPLLALLNPPPLGGDIACGLREVDGGGDLAGADGEVEA